MKSITRRRFLNISASLSLYHPLSVVYASSDLINASKGELEKIRRTYPDFLAKLKKNHMITPLLIAPTHGTHINSINAKSVKLENIQIFFLAPWQKKLRE